MAAAEGGMPDRRDWGLGSMGGGGGSLLIGGEAVMGDGDAVIDRPKIEIDSLLNIICIC